MKYVMLLLVMCLSGCSQKLKLGTCLSGVIFQTIPATIRVDLEVNDLYTISIFDGEDFRLVRGTWNKETISRFFKKPVECPKIKNNIP